MKMKTDAAMGERIKLLQVNVAGQPSGQLLQQSGFEFRYLQADPAQPVVPDAVFKPLRRVIPTLIYRIERAEA